MGRRRAQRAAPETRWPRGLSLFCLAATFLFAVTSFGTYQTDEAAQLQGLYNLRHGNLDLEERPRQFYAIEEGAFLGNKSLQTTQGERDFVNFEALPLYAVLWVASWVVSVPVLLLFGWSAAAYVTAKRGWGRWYEHSRDRPWVWTRERTGKGIGARLQAMTPSHWLLVGALALWTLAQWIQLEAMDFATWGETFAVQATHVLVSALGFVLFFRLVQHETGSLRAASLAGAALLLGPYAAWGIGIKYHAPSMVLTITALWLYQRSDRWRYLAFLAAVLGVAATPLGLPLLGALVLVEAARLARSLRRGGDLHQVAWLGAGLGAALAVLAAFNHVTMGHWAGHLAPFFEAGSAATARDWVKGRVRFVSWEQTWRNLWGIFISARYVDGKPLAIWTLTPLAALAALAPLRLRRWDPALLAAGVGTVLYVAMFVYGAQDSGGSRDLRYFSTMLPMLLLLAAAVAAPRLDAVEQWRPVRAFAIGAAVAVLVLLVLAAAGTAIVSGDPTMQWVDLARVLGTVMWVALLGAGLLSGRIARWGQQARDGVWSGVAGASLVPGALWLFHVAILERRVLPPWPFGSGAGRMTFLMPSLETLRQWAIERTLPL